MSIRYLGTICISLGYIAFFWRTFKRNPGNRLVESGSMSVIAFFVFLAVASLSRPGEVPVWLFSLLLLLVVLLCVSTLFFFAQRAYQAWRRR
jgi:hypothetical protein